MATWFSEHSMQNSNIVLGSSFYKQILSIYCISVKLCQYESSATSPYRHTNVSVELYLKFSLALAAYHDLHRSLTILLAMLTS